MIPNKSKKGFTLPELMISVFILAFVLITLIGIVGAAISSIKKGENRLIAISAAQQIIETYKNDMELDFYTYDLGTYNNVPSCPAQVNDITFSADVIIAAAMGPIGHTPSGNYSYSTNRIRKLTVIIKWNEQGGGERNYKLSTYVNNTH